MAATLAPWQRGVGAHEVRTLRADDVDALRLPGVRSGSALRHTLRRYPERSVWIPETLEYLVVAPWRHRPEIAHIEELVGIRHFDALVRGAFERCVAQGDELLLAIELDSERSPSRYERAGLEVLEEVITYDVDLIGTSREIDRAIVVKPVAASDDRAIAIVTEIDNAAFPWLWRNSRSEFEYYVQTPGVTVGLVSVAEVPVAYFGATYYAGWAHLDRIAVAPRYQCRGFGQKTLHVAAAAMRRRGARRLGLSTQRTNERSQRLYERFGFRRTPELDYRLLGRWCRPEPPSVDRS